MVGSAMDSTGSATPEDRAGDGAAGTFSREELEFMTRRINRKRRAENDRDREARADAARQAEARQALASPADVPDAQEVQAPPSRRTPEGRAEEARRLLRLNGIEEGDLLEADRDGALARLSRDALLLMLQNGMSRDGLLDLRRGGHYGIESVFILESMCAVLRRHEGGIRREQPPGPARDGLRLARRDGLRADLGLFMDRHWEFVVRNRVLNPPESDSGSEASGPRVEALDSD